VFPSLLEMVPATVLHLGRPVHDSAPALAADVARTVSERASRVFPTSHESVRVAFCAWLRNEYAGVRDALNDFKEMVVLQERIELSTSPLPRECSTTELLQRL
jgi:hypothetical protein